MHPDNHDQPLPAFIGLGSNLGNRPATVNAAIQSIDRLPRTGVGRRSSLYRSLPMGVVCQPLFVNAAISIRTRLTPTELLAELKKIERRFARVKTLRWGPRTLDLDILVYGDVVIDQRNLVIPHPGIASRAFVLYPLMEIAPRLEIPGLGTPWQLIRQSGSPAPERLPAR